MKTSLTKTLVATTLLASWLSAPVYATDYLAASLGYYDVFQQDHDAAQLGVEYRMNEYPFGLRPVVGAMVTTDASAYAYAGIRWDVALMPNRLFLIPNFAIGLYREGDGKDLGGTFEFRDGIALEYRMEDQSQIGIELVHYSNASIYDHNPGVEVLQANYAVPFDRVFGR